MSTGKRLKAKVSWRLRRRGREGHGSARGKVRRGEGKRGRIIRGN